jgi:hypothetical protein
MARPVQHVVPAKRLNGRAHDVAYAVRRPDIDEMVTGWLDGKKEKSDGTLWDTVASSSSAARTPATQASKAAAGRCKGGKKKACT